jgi:transcription antitermination protein NusB
VNEQVNKPAKSIRRRARELAMQGIYEWRLTGADLAPIEKHIREEKGNGRYDAEFFSQLLRGVLTQHAGLQTSLAPHLDREMAELSPVEYSILLLAAFELIHCPQTPYRVVINEAVDLAKTFGGTDGHKFVNGVLDKLAAVARPHEFS